MALTKTQLMVPPGGPGILGAISAGQGLNISPNGVISVDSTANITTLIAGTGVSLSPPSGVGNVTVNLLPPTGGNIGGVKQGTNITIAADGTISAQGGSGGITNISVSSPITGGGSSSNVSIGFDSNTTSLTQYLRLSGGTLTGTLNINADLNVNQTSNLKTTNFDGNATVRNGDFTVEQRNIVITSNGGGAQGQGSNYIMVPDGEQQTPSIRFQSGGSIAGFHFRKNNNSVSVDCGGEAVMQWDDSGQCIAGRPVYIGAGQTSFSKAGVQVWSGQNDRIGGAGFAVVRATNDANNGTGGVSTWRSRGTNPADPQTIQAGDTIGQYAARGAWNNAWESDDQPVGYMRIDSSAEQSNYSNVYFLTKGPRGTQEFVKIGGGGALQPVLTNNNDLGRNEQRWRNLYVNNPPVVGASLADMTASPLQSTLGLSFINALTPIQFVWDVEGYDSYGVLTPENPDGPPEVTYTPIPGTTQFWGISVEDTLTTLTSLGLTGNYGVTPDDPETGDSAGIRITEFIAPLIKAVQELSASNDALQSQLDTLQTAFDSYVASHP